MGTKPQTEEQDIDEDSVAHVTAKETEAQKGGL